MDFAITTILLIFLLLPGLLFRRFYYTEEFSKEYFKESIPNFFLSTALPSTLINLFGWQLVTHWYDLDLLTLGILFSGTDDPDNLTTAFENISSHLAEIAGYFTLLSLLAVIAGSFSKLLVRVEKWDRKYKLFRFQNEWHYIFSGEILDFPRIDGKASDIDCTYVDALVETEEGTIIYMGVLSDYILSKTGGIDRIYLTSVKRRFLNQEKNDKKEGKDQDGNPLKYYTLPGEFFIIPFSTIINLHLTYYAVSIPKALENEIIQLVKESDQIEQAKSKKETNKNPD